MLTRPRALGSAPHSRTNTMHASVWPLPAAKCRGVSRCCELSAMLISPIIEHQITEKSARKTSTKQVPMTISKELNDPKSIFKLGKAKLHKQDEHRRSHTQTTGVFTGTPRSTKRRISSTLPLCAARNSCRCVISCRCNASDVKLVYFGRKANRCHGKSDVCRMHIQQAQKERNVRFQRYFAAT